MPDTPQPIHRIRDALLATEQWPEGETPSAIIEELARAMVAAPPLYWQHMGPEDAEQWQQWAHNCIERIDHAEFFALLDTMQAMPCEDIPGEYFQQMLMLAPPRFLKEAEQVLADAIPTATHCDDQGRPVFSAQQIAEHLDIPTEQVLADIERLGLADQLHTGPAYPVQ